MTDAGLRENRADGENPKLIHKIRNLVEGSNPSLVGPAISFFLPGAHDIRLKMVRLMSNVDGQETKNVSHKKTCNLCHVFEMSQV